MLGLAPSQDSYRIGMGCLCDLTDEKEQNEIASVVSEWKKQRLVAKERYADAVRRKWRKVRGMPCKTVTIDVEFDLVFGCMLIGLEMH
jgi:hypothetical protein